MSEMDDATKEFLGVEQCEHCGHIGPVDDFEPPEHLSNWGLICPECGMGEDGEV
jgi:predicted RNA-binding Zn-ribbon protein involved in translation (DUF1610 family)